jgi:glucosamine--fructose-6-phosphate aminotransferase (isomerizing)
MEGAQKLKELSYIHAEAYAAGELKHGPNAVIEPGFPVICLAPKGDVYKKMISNIQEMKARDANILAFATEGDAQIADHADHVVYLPDIAEPLSVLINTIAMQLFAYYVTLYKGYSIDHPRRLKKYYPRPGQKIEPPKSIDIDKPRNLAKSVTVE